MDWVKKNHFSVVISETMAKRFWPGEDPIGKTFRPGFPEMGLPPVTIVGVVGDVRDYGPDSDPVPTFYWSAYHFPQRGAATLVVKTRGGDPGAMAASVRRTVAALDPAAARVRRSYRGEYRFRRGGFAAPQHAVARHLRGPGAAAGRVWDLRRDGLHGEPAHATKSASRMALGAGQSNVVRMVVGKAAVLGGLGVLIGSAAALGLTRLLAGMLYGVKPADPLTFLCVAAILFAVTVAASCAPAGRATRVSPTIALRSE